MKSDYIKKLKIPDTPGVYLFFVGKKIVYVGKATSLKSRVKSYFGKDLIDTRGPLLVDMVFQADKVRWFATESVLEALILEANLIKKHQPKYNTKEKSDKSFNYVVITKEKLPKIITVRGREINFEDGEAKGQNLQAIFGPFTNGVQLREAMKIIRRIFPFLDDKSKNYMEFYKQINLVPDLGDLPRLGKAGLQMYLQNIKNIKLFFEGKKPKIFKNLEKEMKQYAKIHQFEKAGEIKRQFFALRHINDVALLKEENYASDRINKNSFRIEAYDIAHMSGKNMVGVMTVLEDGLAAKNEYRKFKIRTQINANDTGALAEVLKRRFTHTEWRFPDLVVVDGGIAQLNMAEKTLIEAGIAVKVVSVLKDERHKPKEILGDAELAKKYKKDILLGNSEAHRFAIAYHKNMRGRNFLK